MFENGAYSPVARIRAGVRLESGAGVRVDFHADGDLYDLRRHPLSHDHVPSHLKMRHILIINHVLPLSRKRLFFLRADRIER